MNHFTNSVTFPSYQNTHQNNNYQANWNNQYTNNSFSPLTTHFDSVLSSPNLQHNLIHLLATLINQFGENSTTYPVNRSYQANSSLLFNQPQHQVRGNKVQKAVNKLALDNALLIGQIQHTMMQDSFNNSPFASSF